MVVLGRVKDPRIPGYGSGSDIFGDGPLYLVKCCGWYIVPGGYSHEDTLLNGSCLLVCRKIGF